MVVCADEIVSSIVKHFEWSRWVHDGADIKAGEEMTVS